MHTCMHIIMSIAPDEMAPCTQTGEPRVPHARVQYQGFLAGLGRAKTLFS